MPLKLMVPSPSRSTSLMICCTSASVGCFPGLLDMTLANSSTVMFPIRRLSDEHSVEPVFLRPCTHHPCRHPIVVVRVNVAPACMLATWNWDSHKNRTSP